MLERFKKQFEPMVVFERYIPGLVGVRLRKVPGDAKDLAYRMRLRAFDVLIDSDLYPKSKIADDPIALRYYDDLWEYAERMTELMHSGTTFVSDYEVALRLGKKRWRFVLAI